jgi:hypothetical protein
MGVLHGFPIGLAAHNDADERFFHWYRQSPNFLR